MLGIAVGALLIQIASSPPGGEVRGVVRSDATGSAVPGARVELADGALVAFSDSLGGYALAGVSPGAHRLRFVAATYDTLVVDVLLAANAELRLDVSLTRIPATLTPVRVVADAAHDPRAVPGVNTVGAWRISRTDIENTPASDDADAFRLLATAPQAQVQVESQAAVHVRGGASDQNLFLLDGAPVYSPLHGTQAMSAFSPDIVEGLILHGGAPSARYGGRLSSVIDVRTAAEIPSALVTRGALSSGALRNAVQIPLAAGHAGLALSGRHSISGLLREGGAESALPGAWSDVFGKLTLRFGTANIAVSSFISDNGLGFPSTVTNDQSGTAAPLRGRNQFEWTSATQSFSWRQPLGTTASMETRLWRARFDALAVWQSRVRGTVLGSVLRNTGGSSVLSLRRAGGVFTTGFEAERFGTRYDALSAPGSDSIVAPLRLATSPTIASVFAENEWRVGTAWTFDAGLRGTVVTGASPRLEPRLSATVHANARVSVSAGYARMHQYSQSLRNEESLLGAILGPDLLVAYGTPGVPIASSDELAASATFSLSTHTQLDLDWYARALRGLVLVAPVTGEPFATHAFTTGSGHAWGGSASLERRGDRLSLQGTWSLGEVTRRTTGAHYRPAFAPGQSMSIAAAYKVGARTRFRSAIWGSSGRLTTPLGADVGWDTRDAFTGARELSGTPEHMTGPLGGAPLPSYLRIDFGVRHAVPLQRVGITLTGFADLNNALARENVTAYVAPGASAPRRALVMLPPSLAVGLEWKY